MPDFEIHNWNKIADDFRESALILGNGASMAFDPGRFSYASILGMARELNLITRELEQIFYLLDTPDFEYVLRSLWQTERINRTLRVNNPKIAEAYNGIRSALIVTARFIHERIPYENVIEPLTIAADFLSQFRTVISLNYDLLLYWAILIGKDRREKQFCDCFVNGKFQQNWEKFREYFHTLVFYLHGNLMLGEDFLGDEYKISADAAGLLNSIIQKWEQGELTPIFVSEGESGRKLKAINRSPYLSIVFNQVIPKIGEKIVIYGWSMSDQDNHLVEAIRNIKPNKVVVSIHGESSKTKTKCAKFEELLEGFEVVFFDSQSKGCWIYD